MERKQAPFRFERARNFSETYSHTLAFIRENFGPYFRTVLFVAGPLLLLTNIGFAAFQFNMLTEMSVADSLDARLGAVGYYYIALLLMYSFNHCVLAMVVSQFIRVYRRKTEDPIDAADVVRSLVKSFWHNLVTFVGIYVIMMVVLALILAGLIALGSADPAVAGFLTVMSFMGGVLVLPPTWYYISSFFLVRALDRRQGFFKAMGSAARVMRGNFWWSWAIVAVFALILFGLSFSIILPQRMLMELLQMTTIDITQHQLLIYVTVASAIGMFIKSIFDSGMYVLTSIHYFSLKERRDGTALLALIEEIGTKQTEDETEYEY